MVRALSDRGRGHPDRGDDGGDRLDVGDLPGVSRDRRPPAEGDQLRRLHRPLGLAHVRHGQARVERARDGRRPHADGRGGAGSDPRRRHGVLELARHDARHAGRHPGGEPDRRLVGGRSPGRRYGRAERRCVPGGSGYVGRRGAAEISRAAQAGGGGDRAAGHVRHHLEPPGRQAESVDVSTRLSGRLRGRRGADVGTDHDALDQRHLLAQVVPAVRRAARLAADPPLAAGRAEAASGRSGHAAAARRRRGRHEAARQRVPGWRRRHDRPAQAGLRCRRSFADIRSRS